jgi:hypothetical protein
MLAFTLGFSWMHLVVPTLAGLSVAARWILLRRQVPLKAGLEACLISDVPPTGHPTSVLDGGSWVGWWRYQDSQLEVHDQFLVLKRKRDPVLAPIVFSREDVTSLKFGRGSLGATGLRIVGPTNRQYAMIFWTRSAPELRAALAAAGWMRLVK